MSKRNIKDFFPDALGVRPEAVTVVEAPEGYVNKDGERMQLEMKILSVDVINALRRKYTKRVPVKNKNGGYASAAGRVLVDEITDNETLSRALLAEALVYPDLKDPDLQAAYKCYDYVEMVGKIFPTNAALLDVIEKFNRVQGLVKDEDDEGEYFESLMEDAKN